MSEERVESSLFFLWRFGVLEKILNTGMWGKTNKRALDECQWKNTPCKKILSTTYHFTAKDKQCLLDLRCKKSIFFFFCVYVCACMRLLCWDGIKSLIACNVEFIQFVWSTSHIIFPRCHVLYVWDTWVKELCRFCCENFMNFFLSLEGSVGSKHPMNLCCVFIIVIKPFNHILKEMHFF